MGHAAASACRVVPISVATTSQGAPRGALFFGRFETASEALLALRRAIRASVKGLEAVVPHHAIIAARRIVALVQKPPA